MTPSRNGEKHKPFRVFHANAADTGHPPLQITMATSRRGMTLEMTVGEPSVDHTVVLDCDTVQIIAEGAYELSAREGAGSTVEVWSNYSGSIQLTVDRKASVLTLVMPGAVYVKDVPQETPATPWRNSYHTADGVVGMVFSNVSDLTQALADLYIDASNAASVFLGYGELSEFAR